MRRCFPLLLLVGLLAPGRDCSACSCGTKPSAAAAYAASPFVALIRVSRIEDQWTLWRRVKDWFRDRSQIEHQEYYRDYGFLVTAAVLQQWKGAPIKSVQLITGRGGGDCGYDFQTGGTFLVYPRARADGRLQVSICDRITPGQDASLDAQALDAIALAPSR